LDVAHVGARANTETGRRKKITAEGEKKDVLTVHA